MVEFTIAPRSSVVIVTVSGRLTVADARAYIERTYRSTPFLPVTNVLIDLRGLREAPSADEAREIAAVLAGVTDVPVGSRRAIVATDPACLESAARIADSLPQAVGRALFRSPEAALDWLLEQQRDVAAQRRRRSAA